MKKNKNIEQLFQREFENFESRPSPKVWKGVRSALIRKNFLHFSPWSLNVWYLAAFLSAASLAVYLYNSPVVKPGELSVQENPMPQVIPSDIPDITEEPENKTFELQSDKKPEKEAGKLPRAKETVKNNPVISESAVSENKIVPETPEENNASVYSTPAIMAWFDCSAREGCVPFKTTFQNFSQNAVRYSWSFGDGGVSELANPVYIFDEPGTWFVSLTAWSANNEISIFTDTVQVNPNPEARFSMDIQGLTGDEQAVYFYNYSRGAQNFIWNFGDGTTSSLKEPDHYFKKKSGGDIKLLAISEAGCADSTILKDAFNVSEPELIFPTAFSPNTTGPTSGYYSRKSPDNNIFYPFVKEFPEEYQLKIFNRSGILIFESNDINIGWTGYYHEELLPQGVYVWKARAKFTDGKSVVKMGDVTLLWGEK